MNVTLFELHLPDAEFNAPFARQAPATEPTGTDPDAGSAAAPPGHTGPLVVLAVIAGLALIARYLRGGEPEQTTLDALEAAR